MRTSQPAQNRVTSPGVAAARKNPPGSISEHLTRPHCRITETNEWTDDPGAACGEVIDTSKHPVTEDRGAGGDYPRGYPDGLDHPGGG